ncbi:dnaJ homolog subfamily C member 4-like [Oscarella lobularis]|uniref:dnaJ homolog subfamily C member 4-like n=1 Tax=Oscarella lobularis TaxID=121494 RepID=UPI0033139DFF
MACDVISVLFSSRRVYCGPNGFRRDLFTGSLLSRRTFYDVLDVERSATQKEIRASFISKSKKCHPDTNPGNESLHQDFVQLNEAYSVLSDPTTRSQYDARVNGEQSNYRHPHSTSTTDRRYTSSYHYEHDFPKQARSARSRASNAVVVGILVAITVVGGLVQFGRIHVAHETMTNFLDVQNKESNEVYEEVRNRAKSTTTKKQLEQLAETHRKRNK